MTLRFKPLGDGALRFELPSASDEQRLDRRALLDRLRAIEGVADVVLAEHSGALHLHPDHEFPLDLIELVEQVERALRAAAAPSPAPSRLLVIRARYDGPDLAEVARLAALTVDDLIHLHASATYEVRFLGFLPGFAYLDGLHPRLRVPRRENPRPRVPAGSIAVGGPYAGVYPFASPGGWQLLGSALDYTAFDPLRGATLAVGDKVRFEPAP